MEYAVARHNMVESQVRVTGISDPLVLAALEAVPRQCFVPKSMRGISYVDSALDIGGGRVLLEPRVFSGLLQAAAIERSDVVLDIACGTGYSSAVLSHLAGSVVAVESEEDAVTQASSLLSELGVDNVAVIEGVLSQGYPKQAPYSVIVINGAVEFVPEGILNQLEEGGRLVTVLLERGCGQGVIYVRRGDVFGCRSVFNAFGSVLPGFARQDHFVF